MSDSDDPIQIDADNAAGSVGGPPDAPTALGLGQLKGDQLNSTAYRWMRWAAFIAFGLICVAYLIALLCALHSIFDPNGLLKSAILSDVSTDPNWHPLVLFGLALVIFAVVPLSLAMALVKMISEEAESESGHSLKSPHLEALKILVALAKALKIG